MILLRNHNLLFIKGIKVGGTSFEIALSNFANSNDIITPVGDEDERIRSDLKFKKPQNFEYKPYELIRLSKSKYLKSFRNKKERRKYYNHMPVTELCDKLGFKTFNNLTKVVIVRNPFDTLISRYHWDRHINYKYKIKDISFTDWIKTYPQWINQNDTMLKISGEYKVDEFIKFEQFDKDILNFEKKYNLDGLSKIFRNINTKSNVTPKKLTGKNILLIKILLKLFTH